MAPSTAHSPAPRAIRLETRSPDGTRAIGAALGRAAFPGAAILLEGPLGVGKTVLARGVAEALGVSSPVTSPSFAILAIHQGRLPLFHLDLYRLSDPGELRAIDLAEVFESGGVTVVEWPRWLLADPPLGALEVRLWRAGATRRMLELRPRDARWKGRLETLPGASDVAEASA